MFGVSLFTVLLIVWAAVTLAFLVVMAWKSLVGMREEDIIILDPAEAKQAAEQQQVIASVERLTWWAKAFGFASLALLLMVGCIWAYRGFLAFSGGQTPSRRFAIGTPRRAHIRDRRPGARLASLSFPG
jgi:hypothetical protein